MRSFSWRRGRWFGTVLLTLALTGLLALANWWLPLAITDFAGGRRVVGLGTIWETFFARLPPAAPGILGRVPLLAGLVVALFALAYIIVATLRLPE